MAKGKLLHFSVPQFPHLENGHKNLSHCLFGVDSWECLVWSWRWRSDGCHFSEFGVVTVTAAVLTPGILSSTALNGTAGEQTTQRGIFFFKAGSFLSPRHPSPPF